MLIRDAEVGDQRVDVRCHAGRIVEVAPGLAAAPGERVLDAGGGALLRGLHDHHLHLQALAAARRSIPCGPPSVEDRDALAAALRAARPEQGWLRGTGYFESVAGPLDRDALDALRSDVPLRIQHRSGSMWLLNSRAVEALDLERAPAAAVERDPQGRPTGRLFRADGWLRKRLPGAAPPPLDDVGALLAGLGLTAVTDASPGNDAATLEGLRAAQAEGALPLHVEAMGRLSLPDAEVPSETSGPRLRVGAHKILLDEPALPDLDALVERIRAAHEAARPVAVHCVTRIELHFALAAFEAAHAIPGDRIEHASVAPPESLETIRRLGLRVVTQPNFVAERGDAYRRQVAPRDRPHLYRVASWRTAGVPVAGGTDAPFGDPDPWKAMRAAVDRTSRDGHVLGPGERVTPEQALALFQSDAFGSSVIPSRAAHPKPVTVGEPADLCLLGVPWREARGALSSGLVRATVCSGVLRPR